MKIELEVSPSQSDHRISRPKLQSEEYSRTDLVNCFACVVFCDDVGVDVSPGATGGLFVST